MQTSKNSKNGSSEKLQKSFPATPPKLKVPASESDSVSSPVRANRTPKDKSPKVVGRKSPRSPASEKKSSSKVSELESQLSQLQEELKQTKNQLALSESTTKHAQEEAEKAKNELAATLAKLDGSQNHLPVPCQHSSDINTFTETLSLVEELKCQLSEREQSESRALELLTDAEVKLEMAKTVEENLRAKELKAEEAYKSVAFELEKLKSRAEGEKELFEAKAEAEKLKSALDLSEKMRDEENIQNTLLIKSAHEQAEQTKAELAIREAEIEQLKAEIAAYEAESERREGERRREKEEAAKMEAELRRLKVQSEQWRKAAEAAAAMVSSGGYNGKFVERTGSLDKGFNSTIGSKLGSPFSEDLYDDSPKKKNGNMLRKLGVLLKKGQK